jgi:hypothetical protein
VVRRQARGDDVEAVVREWQIRRISALDRDVREAPFACERQGLLEHRFGQVEGHDLGHPRRKGQRRMPCATADVEQPLPATAHARRQHRLEVRTGPMDGAHGVGARRRAEALLDRAGLVHCLVSFAALR